MDNSHNLDEYTLYYSHMRLVFFRWKSKVVAVLALVAMLGLMTSSPQPAFAAVITWDNGGGDGLWSTCTNWLGDVCPGTGDIATFNPAVSDTSSTIDTLFGDFFSATVGGVNIMTGFTGTITQARAVNIGTSGWSQDGGTLSGSADPAHYFAVNNGTFTLSNGTFTAPSATALELNTAAFVITGGTFDPNGGTLEVVGTASSVDVLNSFTFSNLTVQMTGSSNIFTIAAGDTLIVPGTFAFMNGKINGGTVETQAAMSTGSHPVYPDGGTGTIIIDGPAVRTITLSTNAAGGVSLPNVVLNAADVTIYSGANAAFTSLTIQAGAILTEARARSFSVAGNYLQSGGSVDLSNLLNVNLSTFSVTGLLSVTGATASLILGETTQVAGGWTHTGTSTINVGTGLVTMRLTSDINLTGDATFNDLIINFCSPSLVNHAVTVATGVNNQFIVNGKAWIEGCGFNNLLFLQSNSSGVQADVDFAGPTTMSRVVMKDINNYDATPVQCVNRCMDRGDNAGVTFLPENRFISVGAAYAAAGNATTDTSESGDSVRVDVVLRLAPTATVTIPVATSDATEAESNVSSLIFTTDNWNVPQTVTVTGIEDLIDDDSISYSLNIGSATSTDLGYDGLSISVPLKNRDNDTTEGRVDFQNGEDLNILSGDILSDGSSLKYKNWSSSDVYDSNGALATVHDNVIFDPDANMFWEADQSNNRLLKFDPTGVIDVTAPIASPASPSKVVYDSTHLAIWTTFSGSSNIVKLESLNGTPFDTDLATSTYPVGGIPAFIAYDATQDSVWILTDASVLVEIDAATGGVLHSYATLVNASELVYDSVNNKLWTLTRPFNSYYVLEKIDPLTGLTTNTYPLPTVTGDIQGTVRLAFDVTNNIVWVSDAPSNESDGAAWDSVDFLMGINGVDGTVRGVYDSDFLSLGYPVVNEYDQLVHYGLHSFAITDGSRQGVIGAEIEAVSGTGEMWSNGNLYYHTLYWPNAYTTATTEYGGLLPTTLWSTLTEYPNAEITNGSSLYTFSFNSGSSYYIWTGSVWRVIASSLAADHGNGDGDWYYRDSANGWTFDATATATSAIQNAIRYANGSNDMTGATAQSLAPGTWESAPGWVALTPFLASTSYYTPDTLIYTDTWASLTDVTLNETLAGQGAYYAFSFTDSEKFSIWTGSAWRVIASSRTADHGGAEWTWYFRDGANGWVNTFDTSGFDDAIHSLNYAISGVGFTGVVQNQMTGTTVNALTQANLNAAGGWTLAMPIDVSATLKTTSRLVTPSVQDATFSFTTGSTPGVAISETASSTDVTEGGATDTYSVVLDSLPTDSVVVTATGNADVSVSGPLTFTVGNWNVPQDITVTAVNDSIDEVSLENATITHAAASTDVNYDSGLSVASVTAHVTDNDVAGITVGAISGHTTEALVTATFTVVLDTQPTADVSIGVTSDDTSEGTVSPASLTFTSGNWSTPQTVTASGVNDSPVDGDITYHIVLAAATSADTFYSGINPADVTVINDDNDVPSSGGSSFVQLPSPTSPDSHAVSAPTCTSASLVNVLMSAHNATSYMLSIDGAFDTESWLTFTPNVNDSTWVIPTMNLGVMLPEPDGEYLISVRYRSSSGNVSSTVSTQVQRDIAGGCVNPSVIPTPAEPAPTENQPTPGEPGTGTTIIEYQPGCLNISRPKDLTRNIIGRGLSPITGKEEDIIQPLPGDYMRAQNIDTVYCIDASSRRRPFIDETTYFTFERSFDPVVFVTDATLPTLQMGPPMLPKAGVTLVKFRSSPIVYRVIENPGDTDHRVLRPLASEAVAKLNYGENWSDYIIDVDESLNAWFIIGEPITGLEQESLSTFRPRDLLNEVSKSVEQQLSNFTNFLGAIYNRIFAH